MTVYTPRGECAALTASNKRCLIHPGSHQPDRYATDVRKSRAAFQFRLKCGGRTPLKRWRASVLEIVSAHREVSVCYRKATDYRLSGVAAGEPLLVQQHIEGYHCVDPSLFKTQRRFPAARERYVDERHRYYDVIAGAYIKRRRP